MADDHDVIGSASEFIKGKFSSLFVKKFRYCLALPECFDRCVSIVTGWKPEKECECISSVV